MVCQIIKNVSIVCLLVLVLSSCSKTKSGDSPLPKYREEAVYISTDNNNIISYNPENGNKRWEVNLKGPCVGSMAIHNKRLYALTNNGYLYCVDLINGTIAREMNLGLAIPSPSTFENNSLLADNGRIYIGGDKMYCFDTLGQSVWTYDPGGYCTTSPTIKNYKLFFCASQRCFCLDLAGGVIWSSAPIGTDIFSSPTVDNGLVYFGADDKKVHCLKEADGTVYWTYTSQDDIISSPAIYGGMCLIGGNDLNVYCIDTTTGLKRWAYRTSERVISSPTIHEPTSTVLVGSYDFNLYAIDYVTGELKWKYPAGSLIKASPVVYGNYVYFTSFDRYMYCVDARNGKLVWKQFTNANAQSSPIVDNLKSGVYSGISGMDQY